MHPNKNVGATQGLTPSLSGIALQHFTATPNSITPFGWSVLDWAVTGPEGQWTVTLNDSPVNRAATLTVSPKLTRTYRLGVQAGPYSETLGLATVSVDTSSCSIVEAASDPRVLLPKVLLNALLDADKSLYTTDSTEPSSISFQPGRMQIFLHFSKDVNHAPDPSIDVTIECGLLLNEHTRKILPANPSVTGSVNVPGYVDLVPIYGLVVTLEAGSAQEKIPFEFKPLVDAIPRVVEVIYPINLDTEAYQAVTILGDPADPPIRLMSCPKPPDTVRNAVTNPRGAIL